MTDWAQALAAFLDVAGFGRAHILGLSWGGMLAQVFYELYPGRVDRLVLAEWVPTEFFVNASEQLRSEMRTVVGDLHPIGFRLMAKALADTDTSHILETIKVPTLLLWGDGDQRSPLSVAERFHAAIPNSELEVIPGAGHVCNMEKPREFNASVRRFLTNQ